MKKPTQPLSVDTACIALQDALNRHAMGLAGAGAWSDASIGLEDDVDVLTNELWETVMHYQAAVTKLAHRAANKFEAAQKRQRITVPRSVIVTARNPRKVRRDGATR